MSLLPRIPLRKLFIDSRYALPGSTATEFEVEIPQGGLDLLDNTIAMIHEISVPSFPNVYAGRDCLYYREVVADAITFRYIEFPSRMRQARYLIPSQVATAISSPVQTSSIPHFSLTWEPGGRIP